MIKYSLVCREGHEFEAWFQSGATYEAQVAKAQVACALCGSHEVEKAIMAPAVAKRTDRKAAAEPKSIPAHELHRVMRRIREEVHAKAEYVGGRFAEEARKIHFDESPARGIYGEASADDVKGLADDGIPFLPMPHLPEDLN
jgi:hypothetical protein